MPGLHLHGGGVRRGETRRSGPDVVSVRDKDREGKGRRDCVEVREGQDRTELALQSEDYLLDFGHGIDIQNHGKFL